MKTHSGANKRFRLTGTGKVMRRRANRKHLFEHKPSQRSRMYRKAKEQVLHSMTYAYAGRKDRKGAFRRLWIQRINAAARADGMTYNRFIQGLKAAGVDVDRRMLAELAVSDPAAFSELVKVAKDALPEPVADAAA